MFEAGKRYITGKVIADCMYVGNKYCILRDVSSGAEYTPMVNSGHWQEYVEPKVHTTERYVIRNKKTGSVFTDFVGAYHDADDYETLGTIRISHTEGQGLAVEVVQ